MDVAESVRLNEAWLQSETVGLVVAVKTMTITMWSVMLATYIILYIYSLKDMSSRASPNFCYGVFV